MSRRIFIVDDNPTDLMLTSYVLEREGYKVFIYSDPTVFLKEFPRLSIDALILDIEMPGSSGLDVLRAIKEKVSEKNIKVMMLTGRNEMDDVMTAVVYGAKDYCVKPLDPQLFVTKTHKLLGDDPEKAKWQQASLRNSDVSRKINADYEGSLLTISEVELQFISPWALMPGSPMNIHLKALEDFDIKELPVVVEKVQKAPSGSAYIVTAQIVGLKETELGKLRVLSFRLNKLSRLEA